MPIELQAFIKDGPSRYRVEKGFLLSAGGRAPSREQQQQIVSQASELIRNRLSDPYEREHHVHADPSHPALISVATPWAHVHSPALRANFVRALARVSYIVFRLAESAGFLLVGAGVDPFGGLVEDETPALCADIHAIEVLDEVEINRIYNLFRQYLPELIALSANSALAGGALQRDLSTRMRHNPASFTPPPLVFFSRQHIERVTADARRRYGLRDLENLDVSPLSGDEIRLQFVDAQSSLRFVQSQLLLFQAIAVHGRALARQGSQVPTLPNRFINRNKALAIEAGPSAMLRLPQSDERDGQARGKGAALADRVRRASTGLLEAIERTTLEDEGGPGGERGKTILQSLRELQAGYDELAPWLLGVELRREGKPCLVNYGEYQKRFYYLDRESWAVKLPERLSHLLLNPSGDLLVEYNQGQYPQQALAIAQRWEERLAGAAPPAPEPAEV